MHPRSSESGESPLKKARELEHFGKFAALFSGLPRAPINQPPPPEPDIVVARIGVELTELLVETELRRADEMSHGIVLQKAKALYQQADGTPAFVAVHWAQHKAIRDRDALAKRLADFIGHNPPWPSSLRHFGSEVGFASFNLPFVNITIGPASSWRAAEWRDGAMYEVRSLTPEAVQDGLDDKERTFRDARGDYDARFLLFVLESEGASTWSHVSSWLSNSVFDTSYDRVFLMEYRHERVHELLIRHSGSTD